MKKKHIFFWRTHLSYRLQVVKPEGHEGIGVLSSILRRYPQRGQPAEQQPAALVVLLVPALIASERVTHAATPKTKGFVFAEGGWLPRAESSLSQFHSNKQKNSEKTLSQPLFVLFCDRQILDQATGSCLKRCACPLQLVAPACPPGARAPAFREGTPFAPPLTSGNMVAVW